MQLLGERSENVVNEQRRKMNGNNRAEREGVKDRPAKLLCRALLRQENV